MIVHDFEQYSLSWWRTRRGLPSASRAGEILTPTGRKPAGAHKYMAELVADALKLNDEEDIQTEHMARGLELEEEARDWYELQHNADVGQVGMIMNDNATALCSPDGVIWEHEHDHVIVRGLEIKCPMAKNHILYAVKNECPPAYKPQVHMSMVVADLPSWTFMSYFPGLQPFEILVEADEYTEKMRAALNDFIDELEQLKDRYL